MAFGEDRRTKNYLAYHDLEINDFQPEVRGIVKSFIEDGASKAMMDLIYRAEEERNQSRKNQPEETQTMLPGFEDIV